MSVVTWKVVPQTMCWGFVPHHLYHYLLLISSSHAVTADLTVYVTCASHYSFTLARYDGRGSVELGIR